MIRRINFTGRKKLPRTHASIMLYTQPDGPSEFTADLDLSGADLPASARVYVEAYYRSAYQRFDFGTVASAGQYAGERRLLDQLQSQIAFFRVKIVDESEDIGRIIGIIDRIKPRNSDDRNLAETSLLWVNFVDDLGDQIWRLNLSEDAAMPVLEVNRDLQTGGSVADFVRSHPLFFGLVYPAAVREILTFVLRAEEYPADEDDWRGQWLKLGALWSGAPVTESEFDHWDDADRSDWINGVVEAFCRRSDVRANVEAYLTSEGD